MTFQSFAIHRCSLVMMAAVDSGRNLMVKVELEHLLFCSYAVNVLEHGQHRFVIGRNEGQVIVT